MARIFSSGRGCGASSSGVVSRGAPDRSGFALLPRRCGRRALPVFSGHPQQAARRAVARLLRRPAFFLCCGVVLTRGAVDSRGHAPSAWLRGRTAVHSTADVVATAAATRRPLPDAGPLPAPLCAKDGLAKGAAPEDIFTWDTVTDRMPKIMDSVLESLPEAVRGLAGLEEGVRKLQAEMKEGAPLLKLEAAAPRVGAEDWNKDLQVFLDQSQGWHDAPWWVVENYMYKRLLEELARTGSEEAAGLDPFAPQKVGALQAAVEPLGSSLLPILEALDKAEASSAGQGERQAALEMALIRSLWGNQADLSLSAGKVEAAGPGGCLLTDHSAAAVDLLEQSKGREVIVVLDNHGLEVLCDLVLVDAILRVGQVASVVLHVKDAPVFVSDVTEEDIPGILQWLDTHDSAFASRLRGFLEDGRLSILSSPYYTSSRTFWELPPDLLAAYQKAAVVVLKGDANYRRLLGDLHWPYDTDFAQYARSFWPSPGLIALRTMKSGVALGVSPEAQAKARSERPKDWLTSGVFGQVLAAGGCGGSS